MALCLKDPDFFKVTCSTFLTNGGPSRNRSYNASLAIGKSFRFCLLFEFHMDLVAAILVGALVACLEMKDAVSCLLPVGCIKKIPFYVKIFVV